MRGFKSEKTAVLIFAASPEEDAKRKRLSKSELLFQYLTQRTLKTVEQTGLPYFHFNHDRQQGISFGERFSNAVQAVFNFGYENVIIVGNDTPTLKSSEICETSTRLNTVKSVIGPSTDGGFYLWGLHKSLFHKPTFEKFAWQTTGLVQQISSWVLQNSSANIQLRKLSDIDHYRDVLYWINNSLRLPKQLVRLLFNLVYSIKRVWGSASFFHKSNLFGFSFFNKGSPLQYPQ